MLTEKYEILHQVNIPMDDETPKKEQKRIVLHNFTLCIESDCIPHNQSQLIELVLNENDFDSVKYVAKVCIFIYICIFLYIFVNIYNIKLNSDIEHNVSYIIDVQRNHTSINKNGLRVRQGKTPITYEECRKSN